MEQFFFDKSIDLVRILVVGVLAYVAVILFLRVSGKRTLAKMNAFDLVVTVALGSTLATVFLSKDVSLAEGALGLALLIVLQYIVAFLSVRSKTFQQLVRSAPTVLMYQGRILSRALLKARVTEGELRAAVRSAGIAAMQDVEAVVLESDGTFSVIRSQQDALTVEHSSLADIQLPGQRDQGRKDATAVDAARP